MNEKLKEIFTFNASEQRYIYALELVYKKLKPKVCFIAKFVSSGTEAEMLCQLVDGKQTENVNYELKNTPCLDVKNESDFCQNFTDLQELYPNDSYLKQLDITGYLGTRLTSFDQKPVGIFVCLFDHSNEISTQDLDWLKNLKDIIGSELNHQMKCQSYQLLLEQLEMGQKLGKIGTWVWNIKTNQVSCSKEVYNILGLKYQAFPLSFSTISDLIHPDDLNEVNNQISALLNEQSKVYNITHRVILANGEEKTLHLQGNVESNEQGEITRLNASVQDITDIYQLNKQLELSSVVFENASDGIAITDSNNKIVTVNKALENITGYSREELLGKSPATFSSGKQDQVFYDEMWQALNTSGYWQGELFNKRKNGEIFPEELTLNTVKNEQGEVSHYIAIFRDITERKNNEQQLSFFANNEILTGLANRRYFIERLNTQLAIANKLNETFSILFIDINHFKEVNDVFGHYLGDRVLKVIADRILECVGSDDLVCCYGGDEFAVLLPKSNDVNAQHLATKIQQNIQIPYHIDDIDIELAVSIGIAINNYDICDANVLLRNASQAMANARDENHSGISFHDDKLQSDYLNKISLKRKLKIALKENKLMVYYQPIINAQTQKIEKFEALVRWQDNEDGFISPSIFIPVAEEFGLIKLLGDFVLKQACSDLKKIHLLGFTHISFSINRSINEFTGQAVHENLIKETIIASGLPYSAITIEITESVAMSSNLNTTAILTHLKAHGVKVALDDFCTGYSSLSNLIEYDADYLKIDKSFIDNILYDKNSQILTSTLIELAQKLGMKVIAEGVESKAQFELLKDYQCLYIQGYYFSAAKPFEQCLDMLNK